MARTHDMLRRLIAFVLVLLTWPASRAPAAPHAGRRSVVAPPADLVFDIEARRLTWPGRQLTWRAVSGPHGRGALPRGRYAVLVGLKTPYARGYEPAYRDATGRGFWIPLDPQFPTRRTGLGLHPDGPGRRGTAGCIGIDPVAAQSFYRAVATERRRYLWLDVR